MRELRFHSGGDSKRSPWDVPALLRHINLSVSARDFAVLFS